MSFETTDTSIATLCPSRVEGGTVHRSSDLACTKLAPVKKQAFKLSETVCVTAIDVNSTADKLSMVLVSCDPYNPVPTRKTNRAVVFFVFPKGTLGKAAPAKIEEVISQTLSEEHSDAAAKPASPAGAPAAKEAPSKGDPGQSGETKDKDSVPPSNGGTDTDGGRRKGDGPDAQRGTGNPTSSKDQPKQDDTAPADDAAKVSQIEKGETIEQVTRNARSTFVHYRFADHAFCIPEDTGSLRKRKSHGSTSKRISGASGKAMNTFSVNARPFW